VSALAPSARDAVIALYRGEATLVTTPRDEYLATLHTRASAARVSHTWQKTWLNSTTGRIYSAIEVHRDGGFGPDAGPRGLLNTTQGRVLVRCWASFMDQAFEIAQLASMVLLPPMPGVGSNFQAAHTYVERCLGVTEPDEYVDPGDNPYMVAAQFRATLVYRRLAVAS
jgi:hypothetical protein